MLHLGRCLFLIIYSGLLCIDGSSLHHHFHPATEHDQVAQILERNAVDKTVIVGEASCRYLDFAENWLMHIVKLGITNYIMIAMDDPTLQYLDMRYAGHIIPVHAFEPGANMTSQDFMGYDTEAFNIAMCQRLVHQQAILARGYRMLWSDTDTVWFQNILDVIPDGADWVGADDEADGMLTSSQDTSSVCGCLMYWAPTEEAKKIMRLWHTSCSTQQGADADQGAFKKLWNDGTLKQQLRWYVLPHQIFPSGGFEVDVDLSNAHAILPCGIHANWRRGHREKQTFLQERQAWLVPDDYQFPSC